MDIEVKHEELIGQFVKQAATLEAAPMANLVVEATSHPSLFAFSEIIAAPNLPQLEGTQYSSYFDLLRLFAYGTLSDYKSNAARLPTLVPDQVLKLKQLTVLTLAEANKVLPYDKLMQELDVSNVRELEDFLINDCMYAALTLTEHWPNPMHQADFLVSINFQGIVRGKLDQLRRCFEVQFAAGRDPRPKQLNNMICTLENWLGTSDDLLNTLQEKIKWADAMSEENKKHRKEIEDKIEDAKKTLKASSDLRGHPEIYCEAGGMMDFDEDRVPPKRSRLQKVWR